jgi:hypothetical protein
MPAISGRRRHCVLVAAFSSALTSGLGGAAAQDAATFSPTYAASRGSPYSEIYAETFRAGTTAPPLETAAPPAAATAPAGTPAVVYVIEGGRLLTYNADDYAHGGGQALADTALPAAPSGGRLYGAVPPQPASGGRMAPLPGN